VQRDSSRRLAVGLPHYDQLATRASRALILHQVTFRELWEATMALSLATIDLAVERATQEEIATLEANIDATEASLDDPSAVAAYDSEFHVMLEKTARNRVLELAREPSNMLIYPTTHVAVQGTEQGGRRLVEAHRMLVQSLKLRDVELGRLWTRRHLNDWRKGFERTGNDLDQPVDLVTAPSAMA
jgi:GntR family transcriptional repressor for pyruvate dehydrogenase complex